VFKPSLFVAAFCAASQAAGAADLTLLEQRWLGAAYPVLEYARGIRLPIDIIVQPRARPNDVALAMGFDGGRCKLVVSLRGNPDAEKVLADVPPSQQGELIEAMAAHEIAHCWRYARGAWHALPAGFVEISNETAADPSLLAASKAMREMRREEGYADLVALAWIRHRHPDAYARVHAWLNQVRSAQPVAHSGHDTRVWVRLAADGKRFDAAARPFEDAAALWREGLLNDE
jgi:ADP-ribose pyrophosphatase YjhB (NUDIX family)